MSFFLQKQENKKFVLLTAFCAGVFLLVSPVQAQWSNTMVTMQSINVNKPTPPPEMETSPVGNTILPLQKIPQDRTSEQLGQDLAQIEPAGYPDANASTMEEEATPLTPATQKTSSKDYALGPDDQIRIVTYGEEDLSGKFRIGADGTLSFPLVGQVIAQHLTLRDLELELEHRLSDGYLKEPDVSIDLVESRPIYILGEVRQPGSYDYVTGMNVLQAVAKGGGFTYRANQKKVEILRGTQAPAEPFDAKPKDLIKPGDIIMVKERFF